MTRAGFLQSICGVAATAIGASTDTVKADEFDPKGKHFVLTVPGSISMAQRANIGEAMRVNFPDAKCTVLDGGIRLEEIRPLGTHDIEVAVEAGVRRAMESKPEPDNTGKFYASRNPLALLSSGQDDYVYYQGIGNGKRRQLTTEEARLLWPTFFR